MGQDVPVDPVSNVCRSDRAVPRAREDSGNLFQAPRSVEVGDQFVQSSGRLQGSSVREKHKVDSLVTICAIDRAVLPTLVDYWVPGVQVTGVHELVANALNMPGQNERTTNLRGEEFEELKAQAEGESDE